MVRTIPYICMYTEYRESTKDTSLSCFLDTFADCWDVFLRNSTTDNGRLELECFLAIWIHRLKLNFTVTILTTTTGLLSILAVNVNCSRECLFVSYLWSTYISLYIKLTKQTIYDNFQVKLAHTSDDCLTCFLICMCTECRILFCQFSKSLTHLTLIILCLRLDSKLDNRLREFHGL